MIWRLVIVFLFCYRIGFALTFAWISDVHLEIGRQGLSDSERRYSLSAQLLEDAIEKINRDNGIEFVIFTGDAINDGRAYNLDALSLELANLNKPYFLVLGNNDFSSLNSGFGISKQTFIAAFPNCFTNAGKGYWSKSWGNFLLVGIDGIHPKKEGNFFTKEFLRWFTELLRNNSEKKLIIFSHYVPFAWQALFVEDQSVAYHSEIFSLLMKFKRIVGWFCGHLHQEIAKNIKGINFFIAGALVQYPHAYYRVKVEKNKIYIEPQYVAPSSVLIESKALMEKYLRSHPLQRTLYQLNGSRGLRNIFSY